jgi:hypothetical protein
MAAAQEFLQSQIAEKRISGADLCPYHRYPKRGNGRQASYCAGAHKCECRLIRDQIVGNFA